MNDIQETINPTPSLVINRNEAVSTPAVSTPTLSLNSSNIDKFRNASRITSSTVAATELRGIDKLVSNAGDKTFGYTYKKDANFALACIYKLDFTLPENQKIFLDFMVNKQLKLGLIEPKNPQDRTKQLEQTKNLLKQLIAAKVIDENGNFLAPSSATSPEIMEIFEKLRGISTESLQSIQERVPYKYLKIKNEADGDWSQLASKFYNQIYTTSLANLINGKSYTTSSNLNIYTSPNNSSNWNPTTSGTKNQSLSTATKNDPSSTGYESLQIDYKHYFFDLNGNSKWLLPKDLNSGIIISSDQLAEGKKSEQKESKEKKKTDDKQKIIARDRLERIVAELSGGKVRDVDTFLRDETYSLEELQAIINAYGKDLDQSELPLGNLTIDDNPIT
jgi:hypothetical protein